MKFLSKIGTWYDGLSTHGATVVFILSALFLVTTLVKLFILFPIGMGVLTLLAMFIAFVVFIYYMIHSFISYGRSRRR